MKQLEKVQNNTTWAKASNAINNNNDALYVAVTTLEHAAFKNKGYFKSVALLYGAYPTAENGAQAFVYNSSNPTSAPYDIYEWVNGGWQDSGINGGNVNVNLDSKQDTLVGYSESVSGGKATQVAIQGDTIALSGKVSLGNVDNMESAILMSSSQAGAALAKANTVEQSMSALKSPVKPLHLNSQGKLELNIGKGLYVEDGKLCTTGASGGGGGGATLSEGAGISILNNKISVAYNTKTLGIDSCGGLTVNYGEGLTIKNGKLSAQASVNAGNGLVKKGDALQVSVGTGLLVADDVYVNMGKGLATDNENKVNVNLDEQTLTTDSSGKVIVNKDSLIGNGLKQEYGKLAVNYGTGLALSNKAIVINYGAGLDIQGGKLVSTVSSGKTYVAGDGISINGNTIAVQYGTGLGKSTDNKLQVLLGTGLAVEGNYIRVEEAVYDSIEEANAGVSRAHEVVTKLQTALGGKQNTLTLATGLEWGKTDMIQVKMNAPLNYDNCGRLKLDYDSTLTVSNNKLGVDLYDVMDSGGGLFIKNNGLAVNVGRGLKIESCQVVVDEAVMTEVGKISGKQDRLSVSNGLKLANSVLKLRLSTSYSGINTSGLWYDDHGGLMVAVGTGLGIDRKNDGRLYIRCGPGITCNTDNDLTISYGSGLDVLDGKVVLHEDIYDRLDSAEGGIGRCRDAIINLRTAVGGKQDKLTLATGLEWGDTNLLQVKMNAPLNYDNSGRLMLNYDETLTVRGNKLRVNPYGIIDNEGGLTYNNKGLGVSVSRGLKIDSCEVVVDYGTGLKVVNNKLDVDTSKIAGAGIDLDSDYKMLTIGTKAAQELAGKGLVADGSKMKVKYGSGLTTNTCGNLIVDAANLTVGNANKLAGYGIGSFMTFNGSSSSAYVGASFNDSALSKVAAEKYIEFWDDAGGWFNSIWGKVTANGGFVGNLEGTASKATADSRGNNIAATYAKRFTPTNGLAINNDRILSLPYLTSTLGGNAVDGSKNGAQRVLNLSCGAIQIKLSTGLAIDEEGYLYIQDKYVTK